MYRCILLLALFLRVGIAQSAVTMRMDDLIGASHQPNSPITSVPNTLAWIQSNFPDQLAYFTFMKSSKSAQQASSQYPRAIVYGPDASFIFTFNGHPNQPGYDRLEMIQFRPATHVKPAQFEFRELFFKNGVAQISEANPAKCMQCHHAKLRPIWERYDEWPGAYGEHDDAIQGIDLNSTPLTDRQSGYFLKLSLEKTDFLTFKKSVKNHPRYSYLAFPEGQFSPYTDTLRDIENYRLRPNLRLLKYLTFYQAKRIGSTLAHHPQFESIRYALLLSLTNCEHLFKDTVRENLLTTINSSISNNIPHLNWGPTNYDHTLRIRLLSGLGIDHGSWNLGRNPTQWDFFDGNQYLASLVRDELMDILKPDGYQTPKERRVYFGERNPYRGIYDVYGDKAAICSDLAKRVSPSPVELVRDNSSLPPVVQMCASCHETRGEDIPQFAITNPQSLSVNLKANILFRTASGQPNTMPPQRSLSPTEREALQQYLVKNGGTND